MSSGRLPLSALVELCRSLHHNLSAGLAVTDVFEQQASRGPTPVRPVAQQIAIKLQKGHSLEESLKNHKETFPPLFLSMCRVGERSGNLPDIFGELEKFFVLQQRLSRQFWSKVSWPLVQFVLAIFVLAGVIFILGIVNPDMDVLGLGLTGPSGALSFLVIIFGSLGLTFLIWKRLSRSLEQRASLEKKLLNWPLIGPAREALALNRFCLSMRLTSDTSMPMHHAVRMSLRATDNPAFVANGDAVISSLKAGHSLFESLALHGLFPEDFLNVVANAEEGGRLTDVMRQQSALYEEEASRRLARVSMAASATVWILVGGLIILAIFRLASVYLNALNGI